METYGDRVAQLRDDLGWTQEQLALHIGIPPRTLQDIESGKVAKPQRKTREKIDRALGSLRPGQAESEWPSDVQAYLKLEGGFLMALSEESRQAFIDEGIRRLARWNR